MPTINVLFSDLQRLIGAKLPKKIDELNDILSFVKGEVESLQDDELFIEIKDGNRPDLWNVEGIARELRGALGFEEGLREYTVERYSGVEIIVDPRLRDIRPYIASSIITAVRLDYEAIAELMRLQEKLDFTYGRKRRRASIGVYNYDLIIPPVFYKAVGPTEVSFVPLDGATKLSLSEILQTHPKGLEYGHILENCKYWPILLDAQGKVLSFPPIINSNDVGKVTEGVRDIFVEVTGGVYQTVLNTLMIVTLSLADRGEKILSTRIRYPYGRIKLDDTPQFMSRRIDLVTDQVNQMLGLNLNVQSITELLKKARYDAHQSGLNSLSVTIPCYRIDVMHAVDVIEDVAIMYGYNRIDPQWPQLPSFGKISDSDALFNSAREVMIGLGFQEILSFSMSNRENLFDKMNRKKGKIAEIANPMTSKYSCIRDWLLPSLLEFLSKNTDVDYPQKIFEVGACVIFDKRSLSGVRDITKLASVITHYNANFSEIKAFLDAFLSNMGVRYDLRETVLKSFIEGRVGTILVNGEDVGFIGELHPTVLEAWRLETPTAGFELDLERAIKSSTK